jgi:hypothetical protein
MSSKQQLEQSESRTAAAGTTIAVRSSTDLASLNELERILTGDAAAPEVVDDPAEISAEIMAQILNAETDAELTSFGSAVGWRTLQGVPMSIHGFNWRPSSFDEGGPIFFVIQAVRVDTGEALVLTTGANTVLAQLVNMAKRRKLPMPYGETWAIEEARKETKAGFKPLQLRKVSEADEN